MEHRNFVRVLITTPNIYKKDGGVANHFLGLRNFFPSQQIRYCYIGGLRGRNKLLAIPVYAYQYLKFICQVLIFKPDIINLNPSLCSDATIRDGIFLLISKLLNKKVIVFWHGWKSNFEEVIEKRYLKLFKKVFNKADAFVILSSGVKVKLRSWGFSQPIYDTTTKVDDYLVKHLDVKNKKQSRKILFMGRLEQNKGIFEALKAIQISQKRFPDITITYAGEGPDKKGLQEIVRNENIQNVIFSGFVSNDLKMKVLMEADIFILPSYTEGMPTVVLEAMAFGLPIISRPVGGLPDFFIEHQMGYLVNSKDPWDFADKIAALYSNNERWRQISKFNHHYAMENFLASKIAQQMTLIYQDVFNKKSTYCVR